MYDLGHFMSVGWLKFISTVGPYNGKASEIGAGGWLEMGIKNRWCVNNYIL